METKTMTEEAVNTEQNRVADDCPNERVVMRGARDMLKEAAKQFHARGDTGHASMCEIHAVELEKVIR